MSPAVRPCTSAIRSWRGGACLATILLLPAAWTIGSRAATVTPFTYNVIAVRGLATGSTTVAPGDYPIVTFSVTNPLTGAAYDLKSDPAWTKGGGVSRLFLQIGWNTREFTNTDSNANALGGRGAAMPIPINALGISAIPNGDGTYSVTSPLPVPLTASGSGQVAIEGHPAGQDGTGAWTVRVPVKSAFKIFPISGASSTPRRQVVTIKKCQSCHRSDGTGAAPRLSLHGNNRTEEPQVCVMCHNPNNTDAVYRLATDPKVVVGRYVYAEQSLDFKTLVHGIHASTTGFRKEPVVAIGFGHSIFDAGTLDKYPGELRNCVACHVDNGVKGTFELPLGTGVIGSTFDSKSTLASGPALIDTDPSDDDNISPTAAVCSSCHDEGEEIDHMVQTGGASFRTSQAALDSGVVVERCVKCHGPGQKMSVRRVHEVR
jgi:OmcA/MtrC family decaheme c-type cytochrome